MNASDLLRRLHRHRIWSNHRLLEVTDSLSDEQLHRPIQIGQGSVWKTLTHLMAAEYVWLDALLGSESPVLPGDLPNQLPGNQNGADAIQNHLELRSRWMELDRRWDTYLETLDDAALDDPVYKISTSSGLGKRHATRRSDVLLHVCTHAQYTTAQLVNMLRQLGCEQLPDVMLITMARQENECGPLINRLMLVPIGEDGDMPEVCHLDEHMRAIIEMTVKHFKNVGYVPPWIAYLAMRNSHVVGTCAFKSPPSDGRIEIAYCTFPEHERRGLATTMARELVRIARQEDSRLIVFAQTLPEENASTTILKKLGFNMIETVQHPNDGAVWNWELPATTPLLPGSSDDTQIHAADIH